MTYRVIKENDIVLILSLKWGLIRSLSLRSQPSEVTTLSVIPIIESRVSGNTVLKGMYFISNKYIYLKENRMGFKRCCEEKLTSQTTTVPGVHFTRVCRS